MYVYRYIFILIYIYIYIYIHTKYTHFCVYMYTRGYVYTYLYTFILYTHAYTYAQNVPITNPPSLCVSQYANARVRCSQTHLKKVCIIQTY